MTCHLAVNGYSQYYTEPYSKLLQALESYKFSDATSTVCSWWQYQLCDVFIEPDFARNDPKFETDRSFARDTLWLCLDNVL